MTQSEQGLKRIEWASREMPVLKSIKSDFEKTKPFTGKKIVACMHITTETANLIQTFSAAGAEIILCASNPLSTQDDVVAACKATLPNFNCNSKHGETTEEYYKNIAAALDSKPNFVLDDGCDLVNYLYTKRTDLLENVIGGTEETTTGVQRLRAMEKDGLLKYPIVCVNDAQTKHMFDNQYGTGQSTLDGIIRATNTLLAGKTFVVAGYGWCGKGLAQKARGMGCKVVVTEVDPIKALQAHMDGFELMTMHEASLIGDIFVTVTGSKNVISGDHFASMKESVIICNSGHFDSEIDLPSLENMSKNKVVWNQNLTEYQTKHNSIFILAEGRLVNLACANGHPACVMDMSFANQALSLLYLLETKDLENKLYSVPEEIDQKVAELKLKSLGLEIDVLTEEQIQYLNSWQEGT
jgi:adenosylhomocysteinase